MGLTCIHTVPVKDGFLSTEFNENFFHYDALIWETVQPTAPSLKLLLLDNNCKYAAHARNHYSAAVPEDFRFNNGWLHSRAGHDLQCQLRFSSLYAEGVGRDTGEGIEQLWVRPSCHVSQ